jgi:hypothetical protein
MRDSSKFLKYFMSAIGFVTSMMSLSARFAAPAARRSGATAP